MYAPSRVKELKIGMLITTDTRKQIGWMFLQLVL
jgi:hypothetical protein